MIIRNLSHMPKRKVTIDELLGLDNNRESVMETANHIAEKIDNIEYLGVIIKTKDKVIWTHWNGVPVAEALYLLEIAKRQVMDDDEE